MQTGLQLRHICRVKADVGIQVQVRHMFLTTFARSRGRSRRAMSLFSLFLVFHVEFNMMWTKEDRKKDLGNG